MFFNRVISHIIFFANLTLLKPFIDQISMCYLILRSNLIFEINYKHLTQLLSLFYVDQQVSWSVPLLQFYKKSAHSIKQADLFDHILQREQQVKHTAMYYEQQSIKLGYSAASILDSLPYLQMLLTESHLSNQHIEIVHMFLDSRVFDHRASCPCIFYS